MFEKKKKETKRPLVDEECKEMVRASYVSPHMKKADQMAHYTKLFMQTMEKWHEITPQISAARAAVTDARIAYMRIKRKTEAASDLLRNDGYPLFAYYFEQCMPLLEEANKILHERCMDRVKLHYHFLEKRDRLGRQVIYLTTPPEDVLRLKKLFQEKATFLRENDDALEAMEERCRKLSQMSLVGAFKAKNLEKYFFGLPPSHKSRIISFAKELNAPKEKNPLKSDYGVMLKEFIPEQERCYYQWFLRRKELLHLEKQEKLILNLADEYNKMRDVFR